MSFEKTAEIKVDLPWVKNLIVHVKQSFFILFNFLFVGPLVGSVALFPLVWLFHLAEKSAAGSTISLFEWMSILWVWPLSIPMGVPFAYWVGFVPAFMAAIVICVVNAMRFRISILVQGAAAVTALLAPDLLRGKMPFAQSSLHDFAVIAIPCVVATAGCCWLMRRWNESSGFIV